VGAIVLNFKSVTARRINQMRKMTSVPVWQRNYYEHIIRDDIALANIQRYIDDNPRSWWQGRLHPDNPSKG
jgi:putative transposase